MRERLAARAWREQYCTYVSLSSNEQGGKILLLVSLSVADAYSEYVVKNS
jgi:hypothetical protein